jgi:Flp pilus assembly protein TadG
MIRYLKSETGASAAEFALVLPVFLLFVFGIIEFGMLFFTTNQLHWTTESAARCASVSVLCKTGQAVNGTVTNATVGNYANSVYKGLAGATFNYDTNGPCSRTGTNSANSGRQVTGRSTFRMNLGVMVRSINLTANSCFP